ncbi:MAG: fibronectin type III domain-containing protein, partial [Bacteroidales bacterium]|nr:fibronectin type III domain-containing protein [Bacteroidales bacterium]
MKTIVQKLGKSCRRWLFALSLAWVGATTVSADAPTAPSGLTFVGGPYYIRNNHSSTEYLYDSNNYVYGNGNYTPDTSNGSDTQYMWLIYTDNTYYYLQNYSTGNLMNFQPFGDYFSQHGDNNSLNTAAWNSANKAYYGFTLPAQEGTTFNSAPFIVRMIDSSRPQYANRPLHNGVDTGTFSQSSTTNKVYFTTNDYGWGTKNWRFETANPPVTPSIDAPTNVSATANSASAITVSWDAVSGADSYTLYYSNDTQIASGITGTSYPVTGLTAGTAYSFYVKTVDGGDTSAASATVSATTPYAPPVLTMTSYTSSAVNLSWTYGGTASSGYEVWRSTNGGSTYSKLADVAAGTTTYTDASVTEGATYYYKVMAKGHAAESFTMYAMSFTGTSGHDPAGDKVNEEPFKRDTRQGDMDGDGLDNLLDYNAGWIGNGNWARYSISPSYAGTYSVVADIAADNAAFTAYLNDAGNTDTPLATFTGNATGWQNYVSVTKSITLAAGTQNIYFVAGGGLNFRKAVFSIPALAASDYSNAVNATIPTSVPAVPTGLAATASGTTINLSWTAVAGATGYVLQYSTDNSNWSNLATPATNSYADTGLGYSVTRYYRVAATNASGTSAYTASVNATTSAAELVDLVFGSTKYYIGKAGHRWGDSDPNSSQYNGKNARAFWYDNTSANADLYIGASTSNLIDGLTGSYAGRKATYDNANGTIEYAFPESNTECTTTYYDYFKWELAPVDGVTNGYVLRNALTGRYLYSSTNAPAVANADKPSDTGTAYYWVYMVSEAPTTANIDNYTYVLSAALPASGVSGNINIQNRATSRYVTVHASRNNWHDHPLHESANTNDFTFRVSSVSSVALGAAPALSASATGTSVTVSWSAAVAGAETYTLYTSTDGGTNWDAGTVMSAAQIAAKAYTFTGEICTSYTFKMEVADCYGKKSATTNYYVTTNTTDALPLMPATPSLAVTSSTVNSATLAVTNPDNYTLYRGTTSPAGTSVATAQSGASYTDSGLSAYTLYYYKAANVSGECNAESAEITVRTQPAARDTFLIGTADHYYRSSVSPDYDYNAATNVNKGGDMRREGNGKTCYGDDAAEVIAKVAATPNAYTGTTAAIGTYYNIGYTAAGRWAGYRINPASAGQYVITLLMSNIGANAKLYADFLANPTLGDAIANATKVGEIRANVPDGMNDWNKYNAFRDTVTLAAGPQDFFLKWADGAVGFNTLVMIFEKLPAGADLDIAVADVAATAETSFTATATGAAQTDDYTVTFTFNGINQNVVVSDDLAAGDSKTVTYEFTAPTENGSYTLTAAVTDANSDTAENTANATVTVTGGLPAIVINSIETSANWLRLNNNYTNDTGITNYKVYNASGVEQGGTKADERISVYNLTPNTLYENWYFTITKSGMTTTSPRFSFRTQPAAIGGCDFNIDPTAYYRSSYSEAYQTHSYNDADLDKSVDKMQREQIGNDDAYYEGEFTDVVNVSNGQYKLGYTGANEWATYRINVAKAGTYRVTVVASENAAVGTANVHFNFYKNTKDAAFASKTLLTSINETNKGNNTWYNGFYDYTSGTFTLAAGAQDFILEFAEGANAESVAAIILREDLGTLGLTATAANDIQVNLAWNDLGEGVTYILERANDTAGNPDTYSEVWRGTSNYYIDNNGPVRHSTYHYRLSAVRTADCAKAVTETATA